MSKPGTPIGNMINYMNKLYHPTSSPIKKRDRYKGVRRVGMSIRKRLFDGFEQDAGDNNSSPIFMPKPGTPIGDMGIYMNKVYHPTSTPIKNRDRYKGVRWVGMSIRKRLFDVFEQDAGDINSSSILKSVSANSQPKYQKCKDPITMPSHNTEEAALLSKQGFMPLDNPDEFELKNIQLQCAMPRRFSRESQCKMVRVRTDRGEILVAIQGDTSKPAIFTYHDLGVNYLCFQSFFNFVDMRALLCHFCVYHINAPGHEEDAPDMPEDYVYPTMDELANQLNYVLANFGLRSFIGLGVGLGANILTRFALVNPQKVDALVVINCASTQAGWLEWAWQKMVSRTLRNNGMTEHALDNILWHHFGRCPEERVPDLMELYRTYLTRVVNPFNLSLLIDRYTRRTDLGISRNHNSLKVPVLNITGALSPQQESTVEFNARLHPQTSTWMKISDCSMVLEEQPAKVAEAFRLFLQGEGYAVLALQKIGRRSSTSSE